MKVAVSHASGVQFVKYCLVGLSNTLVTLLGIFVCKSLAGIDPYVSNIIGYALGVSNSFIWNRVWVFRSHGGCRREAVRFLIGFGLCYGLQLAVVWLLTSFSGLGKLEWQFAGFTLGGYGIATLIGMVVYTFANFAYNKLFAFGRQG